MSTYGVFLVGDGDSLVLSFHCDSRLLSIFVLSTSDCRLLIAEFDLGDTADERGLVGVKRASMPAYTIAHTIADELCKRFSLKSSLNKSDKDPRRLSFQGLVRFL